MEKKDPPVFSKKEKIIIISIFAILFLASIIVTAYLVSEGYPEQFGKYNLFTAFLIIATIIWAIYYYKYRHKAVSSPYGFIVSPTIVHFIKEKNFTYNTEFLRIHYIKIFILLASIFIQLPLVFCIETIWQSFLSIFIYFSPGVIHAIMDIIIKKSPKNRELTEILYREKTEESQQRFRDNMYK